MRILFVLSFLLCVPAVAGTPTSTEAGNCATCGTAGAGTLQQTAAAVTLPLEQAAHDRMCSAVDATKRSIFQKNGIAEVPFAGVGQSSVALLQHFAGCMVGASGAILKALKDTVMFIVDALVLAGKGVSTAATSVWNRGLFNTIGDGLNAAIGGLTRAGHGVASATRFVRNNGVMASATVAAETVRDAASVTARLSGVLWDKVSGFAQKESKEFWYCLSPQAKTQYVCKVLGYVAGTIAGAKGLDQLAKTKLVTQAFVNAQKTFQARPILSRVISPLVGRMKAVENTAELRQALWITDAASGQRLASVGGKTYIKTVSPKGVDEVFEIANFKGALKGADKRFAQRSQIQAAVGASVRDAAKKDTFSFYNEVLLETPEDFVARVSKEVSGKKVSSRQAKSIATALTRDPAYAVDYGNFIKEVSASFAGRSYVSPQLQQELVGAVNGAIGRMRDSQLNLKVLTQLARSSKNQTAEVQRSLRAYTRALQEIAETGGNGFSKKVDRWIAQDVEAGVLSRREINDVRSCLINK